MWRGGSLPFYSVWIVESFLAFVRCAAAAGYGALLGRSSCSQAWSEVSWSKVSNMTCARRIYWVVQRCKTARAGCLQRGTRNKEIPGQLDPDNLSSCPACVLHALSTWQLIQCCYLCLGAFCSSLGPSILPGQARDSSLIFQEALLLSTDNLRLLCLLAAARSLGPSFYLGWQGFNKSSLYPGGKFTACGLRLQWSEPLVLSKLVMQIYIWAVYQSTKQQLFLISTIFFSITLR